MKDTVKIYIFCDNYPHSHDRVTEILKDYFGPHTDLQIVTFTHFDKPTIDRLSPNGGSIPALQKHLDRHYEVATHRMKTKLKS